MSEIYRLYQSRTSKDMIIQGNCLDKLKELLDNSVDAVVTDPPYGLSFMGKKWDYDVPSVEIWAECLRVLKPGGYLLAFAGTRTQHRMAVRIEDAGFEIRDMIAWVYGSGFPKSLNIGKAIDKIQGNEREVVGELKLTGTARNTKTIGAKTSSALTSDYEINNTKTDITKGTSEWEGWGTALKPALEPITVARKPLSEKSVAENVLKWGTGGINIDGSRVEAEPELAKNWDRVQSTKQGIASTGIKAIDLRDRVPTGRFPSNLIHDGSDEVVGLFPNSKSGNGKANTYEKDGGQWGKGKQIRNADFGDSGSASRFFYCAKASKKERGTSNNHPTVKPTALMEYLVKLVSREGGVVLDPFMGSGSTGIACKKLGREFIGIEIDGEYINIAQKRIDNQVYTPQLL